MDMTVQGPGTISFWWKVSSEPANDTLRFYIGAAEKARTSGEKGWQLRRFTVPAGPQLLKWIYRKNAAVVRGQDRAWVDQVVFTGAASLKE